MPHPFRSKEREADPVARRAQPERAFHAVALSPYTSARQGAAGL